MKKVFFSIFLLGLSITSYFVLSKTNLFSWKLQEQKPEIKPIATSTTPIATSTPRQPEFQKDINGDSQPESFFLEQTNGNNLKEWEIETWDHNGRLVNLIVLGRKDNPKWVEFDTIEYKNGRVFMTNHDLDLNWITQYRLSSTVFIPEKTVFFKANQSIQENQDGSCEISEMDNNGKTRIIETRKNCNIWAADFYKYFEIVADENIIRSRATLAVRELENKNLNKFSGLIHPKKGLVINGNVILGEKLTRYQFVQHLKNNDIIYWGLSDGGAIPIKRTLSEYFARNFSEDYSKAYVFYNEVARGGSTSDNFFIENFLDKPIITYYFPYTSTYTNDKGETVENEMSWKSVNLIFEKHTDGVWYLIGIQEDEWSI